MQRIEQFREFGGYLSRYTHPSAACGCEMTFSVYLPPQAEEAHVPALYWLSGLTCSDDNFRTKAGAQRYAAELGIALIIPDTSPRGGDVFDAPDRYDLGHGAGFYVDATREPWARHYRMYDYVARELPELVESALPLVAGRRAISGHSMGGHGALVCALRNPEQYRSVSAFAPIANPSVCPWGEGCFGVYLGEDRNTWRAYDATYLVEDGSRVAEILIDQGTDDEFLADQLYPQNLRAACLAQNVALTLRMQDGYDHSYHFISTFIGEHLAWHAERLYRD